ncbi:hypothetical protein LWI29_021855 [Acer saccharum]|uniref:Uncharacterized protein n=1 Tax=Acer saccharum TaxID=4024 RepID=A0AA39SEK7_ACESA|nr:hypothetical protein LWI29_021855 [Acer saccharum]
MGGVNVARPATMQGVRPHGEATEVSRKQWNGVTRIGGTTSVTIEKAAQTSVVPNSNNGGRFVFKGTQNISLTQVVGSGGDGKLVTNMAFDSISKDLGIGLAPVAYVQNTSKMKGGSDSIPPDTDYRSQPGMSFGIMAGTEITGAELSPMSSGAKDSRGQMSAGSWKRRARGVGSGSRPHEGGTVVSRDDRILGKREGIVGGVSDGKRQHTGPGSADDGLCIGEFFTIEPYACEPSSLPKYPPNKEMDVKLRDEEARRFTFLSFFMFTMSWINIGR